MAAVPVAAQLSQYHAFWARVAGSMPRSWMIWTWRASTSQGQHQPQTPGTTTQREEATQTQHRSRPRSRALAVRSSSRTSQRFRWTLTSPCTSLPSNLHRCSRHRCRSARRFARTDTDEGEREEQLVSGVEGAARETGSFLVGGVRIPPVVVTFVLTWRCERGTCTCIGRGRVEPD